MTRDSADAEGQHHILSQLKYKHKTNL